MSIASEISRLNTAKADIKAVLESKGITVPSSLKIDGYAQLINDYLQKETRVVAKFNVTSTSSPTRLCNSEAVSQFSEVEIDGVAQPSVISEYTFSTTGEHTVKYTLTDPTSIGVGAFYYCTGLTSVTIPNSVTSIGNNAFQSCTGLTSVTIPNSVTSIGNNAFYYCSGLTSVTISNSVTSIGDYAFCVCSSLTSVTIPNSVTSIGQEAFSGCSNLTSITIGNSVTSIGDGAFSNCSQIATIVVESGNSVYDSRDGCNAIISTNDNTLIAGCKNTIIHNSVTSIGASAFRSCNSLTSVTIPNSVTSIGNSAFYYCSGLTSVTIGNSVTSIGKEAFRYCSNLTSVHITDIAAWCNISFVNTNSNPLQLAGHLYMNGSEITDLVIPNNVTRIESYVFYNCSGLTSVTIPNSVTSIRIGAFRNCTGLTSITSNATTAPTITSSTFRDVKDGGTLTVPIGSTGYDTWMGTGNYYLGKYNWTLDDGTKIIAKFDVTDTSSPTQLCDSSFGSQLSEIEIDGVVQPSVVSSYTFSTTGIHIVRFTLADTTSIGGSAFRDCINLASITIPNSVTSIEAGAFYNCSGLTSIIIPNSVTSIGVYAFYSCTKLASITSLAIIAPTIQRNTFRDVKTGGTLTVPTGSSGYDVWMQNANYYLGLYNWTKVEQ